MSGFPSETGFSESGLEEHDRAERKHILLCFVAGLSLIFRVGGALSGGLSAKYGIIVQVLKTEKATFL